MNTYVNQGGDYYKSKKPVQPGDQRVPDRPSGEHYWVDGEWILRGDKERWLDEYIRPERDRLLTETIWIHERQSTAPSGKKMSDSLYQKWCDYWQALRDLPDNIDVENPQFPEIPDFAFGDEEKELKARERLFKRIRAARVR